MRLAGLAVLVSVRMFMPPSPVSAALLFISALPFNDSTALSIPITTPRALLAFIPLVIIAMIAIVITFTALVVVAVLRCERQYQARTE
jgi:hypothetical protein